MSGIKVRRYSGTVPASGKQVFTFGTEKFCHRSIAKDKSDYLVRLSDKAILRAYPIKTDRMVVIEDLAQNLSKLTEAYELYEESNESPKQEITTSESCGGISMKVYSDGSRVVSNGKKELVVMGTQSTEFIMKPKKSYDLTKKDTTW